jgi:hypothetical protein
MKSFDEVGFKERVEKALQKVRTLLHVNRIPQYPSDVQHEYKDKYGLAEFLTHTAVAGTLNVFEFLGVTSQTLATIKQWSNSQSVTLRFHCEERCNFTRDATRKEESKTQHVTEVKGLLGGTKTVTSKVVTEIHEYFWAFECSYQLFVYRGADINDKIVLQERLGRYEIVSQVKAAPRNTVTSIPTMDLNITWLLQQVNNNIQTQFSIDRTKKSCHTPRRNDEVESALSWFNNLFNWSSQVFYYFNSNLLPIQSHDYNVKAISDTGIFNPIQPLFDSPSAESSSNSPENQEYKHGNASAEGAERTNQNSLVILGNSVNSWPSEPILPVADVNLFLSQQRSSLRDKISELSQQFPGFEGAKFLKFLGLPAPQAVHAGSKCENCAKKPILGPKYTCEQCKDYNLCGECWERRENFHQAKHTWAKFEKSQPQANVPLSYDRDGALFTLSEAVIKVLLLHCQSLAQNYSDGCDFIEKMLRNQLISALGKEISAQDFMNYMRFHWRKVYRAEFQPQEFSYAVRRPEHAPEGVISIEIEGISGPEAILTSVRKLGRAQSMAFPINAATKIEFQGDFYLHAWLNHQFEGNSAPNLNLCVRARQFSSFIVLLGRINSATEFAPKHAIILQNKDDLKIPLELETIPSAKEFRDAISSLSPEQQRFAKAYRAMQLESTLFGIVIIQLKPQLERVLNLPNDSLTKEIALTEELLELFIKYQIPSDQLSYDPVVSPASDVVGKLAAVKRNAAEIFKLIEEEKAKQLEAARKKTAYSRLDNYVHSIDSDDKRKEMAPLKMLKKGRGGGLKNKFVKHKDMDRMSDAPAPPCSSAPQQIQVEKAQFSDQNAPVIDQLSISNEQKQPAEQPRKSDLPSEEAVAVDFSAIPAQLDGKFESLDEDGAVRPTIINIGTSWIKKSQKALLADPTTAIMGPTELKSELNRAFDLLDALSRSGTLAVEGAELHVVTAATHVFTDSLINTIIQDNINPIEKLERSSLIIATTVQGKEARELIKREALPGIKQFSAPALLSIEGEDFSSAAVVPVQ